MSVDKFGRFADSSKGGGNVAKGPPGEGFKLTDDGNFDLDSKVMTNVADPIKDGDAVNYKSLKDRSKIV